MKKLLPLTILLVGSLYADSIVGAYGVTLGKTYTGDKSKPMGPNSYSFKTRNTMIVDHAAILDNHNIVQSIISMKSTSDLKSCKKSMQTIYAHFVSKYGKSDQSVFIDSKNKRSVFVACTSNGKVLMETYRNSIPSKVPIPR